MSSSNTGPLVDSEKVDTRRFCGYPAYGLGPGDDSFQRFFVGYEHLEYRQANLTTAELAVARNYLATLNTLEAAIPGAAANLDTDKASVWTHNKQEVRDRTLLFDDWRRRYVAFLGVQPGPYMNAGAPPVRLIV